MTLHKLESYKRAMHHHVVVTMKDGKTVEGHMQPWSQTTLYITPLRGVKAETVKLPIEDIDSIKVRLE